jgi:hypothetical protein
MRPRCAGFGGTRLWTGCFLVIGLGLRLYHFLRNPSVWHDEAALILNVLGKGYRDLLGPLLFGEAAPPLFLWLERGISGMAGDGTYALRLLPLLASCMALALLAVAARRLLSAQAAPWAVLLFACSNRLLWHSCEAKPYALDVLLAVGLLVILHDRQSWPLGRQLALATLLAPLVVFLCYPGGFLYGGVLVALLPEVWQRRHRRYWLGYLVLAGVVAGCFVLLVQGPVQAQRCQRMDNCWDNQFPPAGPPGAVLRWTVFSSLDVLRYCFEPTGQLLAPVGLVGAVGLWRNGKRRAVILMTMPALLALLASFLHAYPWGGVRVEAYLTPAAALFIAAGVPMVMTRLQRHRPVAWALALILVAPASLTAYRTVVPWPRADCAGAAAYVLAHRRANDRITANHWEYWYYFRNLRSRFTPMEDFQVHPLARLWVVLTGADPDCQGMIDPLLAAGGWRIREKRQFHRTAVYLLFRPKSADRPNNAPQDVSHRAAAAALPARRAMSAAT